MGFIQRICLSEPPQICSQLINLTLPKRLETWEDILYIGQRQGALDAARRQGRRLEELEPPHDFKPPLLEHPLRMEIARIT